MKLRLGFLCAISLPASIALAQTDRWLDLMREGTRLETASDYVRAATVFRNAVQEGEAAGGTRLVTALNALGNVEEALGQFTEADRTYHRALAISKDNDQLRHDYALTLGNLGGNYLESGNLRKAEEVLSESLAIFTTLEPPDSIQLAVSRNALANLLGREQRFAEAEKLLEGALATFRKSPDLKSGNLAAALNNLGVLRRLHGQKQESVPLLEESVVLAEAGLPPHHPVLLHAVNNLATAYAEDGRYSDAGVRFQQALAIAEDSQGASHPFYAQVLLNYAGFLRVSGKNAAARKLQARANSVLRQSALTNGRGMTVDVSAFRQ